MVLQFLIFICNIIFLVCCKCEFCIHKYFYLIFLFPKSKKYEINYEYNNDNKDNNNNNINDI
jgi:hypothetical protein